MTVKELCSVSGFNALTLTEPDREITGVYVGDLLSWVMGRAGADTAWITIMSNVNVLAVATLADVACVILAEGVALDESVISQAKAKHINVITSPLSAYECAVALSRVIE